MSEYKSLRRKVAAHRIYLADGTVLQHEVVELDSEGRLLSHHPLQGEEPFVEWYPEFRQS